MRGQEHNRAVPMSWLGGTLVLGVVFIVGQYLAWLQLRSMGLFLATNPNSSFFYLLTAVHAIHVLGGLGGLIRVIVKFIVPKFRYAAAPWMPPLIIGISWESCGCFCCTSSGASSKRRPT